MPRKPAKKKRTTIGTQAQVLALEMNYLSRVIGKISESKIVDELHELAFGVSRLADQTRLKVELNLNTTVQENFNKMAKAVERIATVAEAMQRLTISIDRFESLIEKAISEKHLREK